MSLRQGQVELVSVKSTLPTDDLSTVGAPGRNLDGASRSTALSEIGFAALYEMSSDPDVAMWMSTGITYADIEVTRESLEPVLQNILEMQDYVICLASTGESLALAEATDSAACLAGRRWDIR
ncbi:hypothetical protein MY11210_006273 [Beauveria gryllotalpidicola]